MGKRQTITFTDEQEQAVERYRAKKQKDTGKVPSFQKAVIELVEVGLKA